MGMLLPGGNRGSLRPHRLFCCFGRRAIFGVVCDCIYFYYRSLAVERGCGWVGCNGEARLGESKSKRNRCDKTAKEICYAASACVCVCVCSSIFTLYFYVPANTTILLTARAFNSSWSVLGRFGFFLFGVARNLKAETAHLLRGAIRGTVARQYADTGLDFVQCGVYYCVL